MINMQPQERIVRFVRVSNWVLFTVAVSLSFFFASKVFALGVLTGGAIVTVNFHLLTKTLQKAFRPPYIASYQSVIAKYYLRFLLSGVIIFILLGLKLVHPLGLIIGLSVVAASFMLATLLEIKKLIFKEAL